jgi:hypothetical protein
VRESNSRGTAFNPKGPVGVRGGTGWMEGWKQQQVMSDDSMYWSSWSKERVEPWDLTCSGSSVGCCGNRSRDAKCPGLQSHSRLSVVRTGAMNTCFSRLCVRARCVRASELVGMSARCGGWSGASKKRCIIQSALLQSKRNGMVLTG